MKKIKTKIVLGVSSLFLFILILSFLGIFFINKLAQGSKGTIKDNYASVGYAVSMLNSIDSVYVIATGESGNLPDANRKLDEAVRNYYSSFNSETDNITETGETALVKLLRGQFKEFYDLVKKVKLQSSSEDKHAERQLFNKYSIVRGTIAKIYSLNMSAVLRRNGEAEDTANGAALYMVAGASVCILLTILFIFSFPSRIVKPITELTEKIKAISRKNYDQQLDLNSEDEMGQLASAFNAMVTRLKEYDEINMENMLFEKKRLDTIVKNLLDGVIFLDENKLILLINDAALRILGKSEKEVLGRNTDELSLNNELLRTIKDNLSGTRKSSKLPVKIFVDGKEQYFNIESFRISTGNTAGQPLHSGYVIILKNITWFQERDSAKTNLIATVSHELKTPLSSINLSVKMLEDTRVGNLNVEQKDLVKSVREQSHRLSKVVNELLDYTQAETGNIKLNIVEVKADELIELAVLALMMFITEKDINIATNIPDALPPIKADIEKCVWVLVNLLNNAIRYSKPHGKIEIIVKGEEGFVKFAVKDYGPGISDEDKEKLFQKFVRVGTKLKKGTGLGLAISKDFVEAQGGRIWLESRVGEGSTFYFTLHSSNVF